MRKRMHVIEPSKERLYKWMVFSQWAASAIAYYLLMTMSVIFGLETFQRMFMGQGVLFVSFAVIYFTFKYALRRKKHG